MKIIVGLGNYGAKYEDTRHNIGFAAADRLASNYGINITTPFPSFIMRGLRGGQLALIGKGVIEEEDVLIAKPHTYMNRSGIAVSSILYDNSLLPSDLIVIHDDIDLAVGKVKKKIGGGDAGHRGIRSIIGAIGTEDFHRIRIGVGRPPEDMEASDYVLSPFRKDELEIIEVSIEKAIELMKEIIKNSRK